MKSNIGSLVVLLTLFALHEATAAEPLTSPSSAPETIPGTIQSADLIETYKTVKDKNGADFPLVINLFRPKNLAPGAIAPVMIWFHGGYWSMGKPAWELDMCRYYAQRGFVTISPSYRLAPKFGTTPVESMQDAKSCIRYVRKNAARLGIDPERLILGGFSAGGQLALPATMREGFDEPGEDISISTRPSLFLLRSAVYDTTEAGCNTKPWYGGDVAKKQVISPVHHITAGLPPGCGVHGEADTTSKTASAHDFSEKMKAQNNDFELHIYPAGKHGFFNPKENPDAPRWVSEKFDAFLVKHGFPLPVQSLLK